MKRSALHYLILSVALVAMSGCVDPTVLVSLKEKVIETFNPGGTPPPGNSSSAILSANYSGFCLAEGGSDLCWGKSTFIGSSVPYAKEDTSYPAIEAVLTGKTIKKMAMGSNVSCVIASDDKLYCWGDNSSGALGIGAGLYSYFNIPLAVSTAGVLNGKNIIDVAIYGQTVCAIDSTFVAYCWGNNVRGQVGNASINSQINLPAAVSAGGVLFKKIKMGNQFTCGVSTTDTVWCWGINSYGQLGYSGTADSNIPMEVDLASAGVTTVKDLQVSDYDSCVIANDDKVYCWGGMGTYDYSPVPKANGDLGPKTVKKLSISGTVVCVIASDDLGYCYGANTYGQLGVGTTVSSATFKAISTTGDLSSGFKELKASDFRVCALSFSGVAYCWGASGIGDGAAAVAGVFANRLSPTAVDTSGVLSGKVLDKIVVDQTMCAIDVAGEMYCWGPEGNRGDGVIGDYLINTPVAVLKTGGLAGKTFKEVQVDFFTTCSIASDDQMYCWGSYRENLGVSGASYDQLTPKRVYSPDMSDMDITNIVFKFKDMESNTCVQRSNGDFYCHDNTSVKMVYYFSMGSEIFTKVRYSSTGNAYCGLTVSMKVYCWGDGSGVILHNDSITSQTPVEINTSGVLAGKMIEDIYMGEYGFACVLADAQLYCWGANYNGQLGDGTMTDSKLPVAVSTAGVLNGKTIKNVQTSGGAVCVIASDDRAYCWGEERLQGNGASAGDEYLPAEVLIPSGEKVEKLVMNETVCVITDLGNLYCWGDGSEGVLGAGIVPQSQTPTLVHLPGNMTVKDVSLSNSFACAIGTDALAYCWGKGDDGQMGRGSNVVNNLPGMVSTPSGVELQNIVTGNYSACALSTDSKVYCWGRNNTNQLGNNSTTDSNVPVEVEFTP